MLLSFYLLKIRDCMDDFVFSYEVLRKNSEQKTSNLTLDKVWDSVQLLCRSCAQTANIFAPNCRGDITEKNPKRKKEKKEFSKKRGEALRSLFLLNFSQNNWVTMRDARNRFIHFDEDVDIWFFESDKTASREIVWRALEGQKHDRSHCVIQRYDRENGILQNFGTDYLFSELKNLMQSISAKLNFADVNLSKIAPNRTRVIIS